VLADKNNFIIFVCIGSDVKFALWCNSSDFKLTQKLGTVMEIHVQYWMNKLSSFYFFIFPYGLYMLNNDMWWQASAFPIDTNNTHFAKNHPIHNPTKFAVKRFSGFRFIRKKYINIFQ